MTPALPRCLTALPLIVATLLATRAAGAADTLDTPLLPADSAKPLTMVEDRLWTGPEIRGGRDVLTSLKFKPFAYDASKGALSLIIDYAGVRTSEDDGDALIEISIECPEAREPCAIPIEKGVVDIRTGYMTDVPAVIGGQPVTLLAGRESHDYRFGDGTVVNVWLQALEHRNLEPKAIRARLVYGEFARDALHGDSGRTGSLKTVLIVVGVLTALVLLWLKKR
jgi:hypothetical protein